MIISFHLIAHYTVLLIGLCLAAFDVFAQPLVAPAASGDEQKSNDQVHIGVSVFKPSASVYAQLPDLPKGCGFVLQSVKGQAPAAKAGLKAMDVIWKLDGQLLVNESQMLVLLSHKKPGDRVKVHYFRSGKSNQLEVTLNRYGNQPPHPGELAITPPTLAGLNMPLRVISYEDRSASISDKTGIATLSYREGKPWLHVKNDMGVETYDGYIDKPSGIALVPAIWRNRLPLLQRSLDESIRLRKLPRVRRVVTPKQTLAVDTP